MKNLSKLLTTSMILGILFLGFHCTKEKSSPPPESGPQHPVVGEWEWTHSYFAIGDSTSPASAKQEKTMYFRIDDSVEIFQHHYRSIDTSYTNTHYYKVIDKYGIDSIPHVFIGNNAVPYSIPNDTILIIDQMAHDGPQEWFARVTSP